MRKPVFAVATTALALNLAPARADQTQAEIAASPGAIVEKVHAVGAQVYECKADGHGGLAWSFREPIATLMNGGKTVGHHFAGPTWEMADGSVVTGKPVGKAPGSTADDIPWLRLEATAHGEGVLGKVTTVQRVSTVGGNKAGPCSSEGAFLAMPYEADYIFSRP